MGGGLACEHGLVHHAGPRQEDSVAGAGVAGDNADDVAGEEVAGEGGLPAALAEHRDHVGCLLDRLAQRLEVLDAGSHHRRLEDKQHHQGEQGVLGVLVKAPETDTEHLEHKKWRHGVLGVQLPERGQWNFERVCTVHVAPALHLHLAHVPVPRKVAPQGLLGRVLHARKRFAVVVPVVLYLLVLKVRLGAAHAPLPLDCADAWRAVVWAGHHVDVCGLRALAHWDKLGAEAVVHRPLGPQVAHAVEDRGAPCKNRGKKPGVCRPEKVGAKVYAPDYGVHQDKRQDVRPRGYRPGPADGYGRDVLVLLLLLLHLSSLLFVFLNYFFSYRKENSSFLLILFSITTINTHSFILTLNTYF